MLNVLFFIEPVVFRDDPLLLQGWVQYCGALAARSRDRFRSFLAAPAALIGLHAEPDPFETRASLSPAQPLVAFDFDRASYGADLYEGEGVRNPGLVQQLEVLRARFAPDIVISWSQNRYLGAVFGAPNVFFMELGPLPRRGLPLSAHLDPCGHQVGSALDRVAAEPFGCPSDFGDYWEQVWLAGRRAEAEATDAAEWIDSRAAGRSIDLVALQSPDWLTYEATGPHVDPTALLQRLAAEAAPDEALLPVWHPGAPPTHAALDRLGAGFPSVMLPAESLRTNTSEMFLPSVGQVTTISSNVAAAAAISGLPLRLLGRCKFEGFARAPRPRPDLLAFLMCRYCRPLDAWLEEDGLFADDLLRLWEHPEALFRLWDTRDATRADAWFAASTAA